MTTSTSNEAGETLTPFWVSWWDDLVVSFELHSPWWFSGCRFHGLEDDDEDLSQSSVCAAIMAADEAHVRRLIGEAYDVPVTLEFRFVEPRPVGWSPFSDRFQRGDWMRWPVTASNALGGAHE